MIRMLKTLQYRNKKLEFLTLACFMSMVAYFVELAVKFADAEGAWVSLVIVLFAVTGTISAIALFRLKDENKEFKITLALQVAGVVLCLAAVIPSRASGILDSAGTLALIFGVFEGKEALSHVFDKGVGPKAELIRQFSKLTGAVVVMEDIAYLIVLICQFFLSSRFPVLLSVISDFEEIILFSISVIYMCYCAAGMLIDEKVTD